MTDMNSTGLPEIPSGFISMMKESFPEIADTVINALDSSPSVAVRINNNKNYDPFPDAEPIKWCESGKYLSSRPVFTLDPLFHAGAYYVQDPSSMIYQYIISQLVSGPVSLLDLCAAPGGKTTAAINAIPEGSVIVANEYVQSRANILLENITKWGFPDAIVTNSSADNFGKLPHIFDILMIDAPCSGEGMMRKESIARIQWSPSLIRQCSNLQYDIVKDAIPSLKPGGYLIYSTCTFNREENERNLERFITEFNLEPIELEIPANCGILTSGTSDYPAMRFMPGLIRGEGLFVAVMRKKRNESNTISPRKNKQTNKNFKAPDISHLIKNPNNFSFSSDGNTISAISHRLKPVKEAIEAIKGIKILSAGVEIASIKGKDLIPSCSLALSSIISTKHFPDVELSLEDALSYLRRETIVLPQSTPKGFVIVTYKNIPLGFVKNLGNRSNNLYPQKWRIRNL